MTRPDHPATPAGAPIPPIRRSVTVSWAPDAAFRRFTEGFAEWWPRATHSIGGALVKDIVFECREGGQIVEELHDGRRYQWGTITAFEPPHRVAFTWHPSQEPAEAQDVEIRFVPDGTGTRVELISSGWERLGPKAKRMRRGYDVGWSGVLGVFAGRRSTSMLVFGAMSRVMTFVLRVTGRLDGMIDKAGGRLPSRTA